MIGCEEGGGAVGIGGRGSESLWRIGMVGAEELPYCSCSSSVFLVQSSFTRMGPAAGENKTKIENRVV